MASLGYGGRICYAKQKPKKPLLSLMLYRLFSYCRYWLWFWSVSQCFLYVWYCHPGFGFFLHLSFDLYLFQHVAVCSFPFIFCFSINKSLLHWWRYFLFGNCPKPSVTFSGSILTRKNCMDSTLPKPAWVLVCCIRSEFAPQLCVWHPPKFTWCMCIAGLCVPWD